MECHGSVRSSEGLCFCTFWRFFKISSSASLGGTWGNWKISYSSGSVLEVWIGLTCSDMFWYVGIIRSGDLETWMRRWICQSKKVKKCQGVGHLVSELGQRHGAGPIHSAPHIVLDCQPFVLLLCHKLDNFITHDTKLRLWSDLERSWARHRKYSKAAGLFKEKYGWSFSKHMTMGYNGSCGIQHPGRMWALGKFKARKRWCDWRTDGWTDRWTGGKHSICSSFNMFQPWIVKHTGTAQAMPERYSW